MNGNIRQNSVKLDELTNLVLSRKTSSELQNIMTYGGLMSKYNLTHDENDFAKISLPRFTNTQFELFEKNLMENNGFKDDLVSL